MRLNPFLSVGRTHKDKNKENFGHTATHIKHGPTEKKQPSSKKEAVSSIVQELPRDMIAQIPRTASLTSTPSSSTKNDLAASITTSLPPNHQAIEEFLDIDIKRITPSISEVLPYGDGSNKIFGYENFGNTCYCNSILQCLFFLDDFRIDILKHPRKESIDGRKLKYSGNTPRIFTLESFENMSSNNNSSGTNNPSKPTQDNENHTTTVTNPNSVSSNLISSTTANTNSNKPNDPLQRRNSFMSSFSKSNSDRTLSNNNSSANSNSNISSSSNKSHIEPTHTVIMTADSITEKLHNGCEQIIIGRKTAPSLLNYKSAFEFDDPYNSEQRKKVALITGPVLNIDHTIKQTKKPNLYLCLRDIFECVVENENLTGVISPYQFVRTLKKENILFSTMMQQDAHEFLNFLLNELNDFLQLSNEKNFILDQFQGTLTNQIKCLTCDTLTSNNEPFLDFPIEVKNDDEDLNIQDILNKYHQREILNGTNKFYCNQCHGLQEAERIVGLKKLPHTLALHLKRFKYLEEKNANTKLFNKIEYPLILSVSSTFNDSIHKKYELISIVVHLGGGPHHGHYVSICKSDKFGWLLFDDETVESINEETVLKFVGDPEDQTTAYVLFYREIDCDNDKDCDTDSIPLPKSRSEYEANIECLVKYDDKIKLNEMKRAEKQKIEEEARIESIQEEGEMELGKTRKNNSHHKMSSQNNKNNRKSKLLGFVKV
ncbi:hypothetical protein KAFR_0K01810 [Kazachstania africana CBS 2517]|uniref:Ubiquitin carboxyl-terminal hydrolase n=1 Tax=Kazachstania africana (strain ATCC 22294 / BCRC 22015 / CBS 2517 / CECT 1963 / NBRC 1671 / NRRL Y-8276) TaxID=1071382 RepID=H2B1N5_KAZAF|nr:hypothetical protein KAFR_0K01810 [Kazachstania africana CBS 2517]CCF60535.1 hypothetical protein KAFR_0K01810 [Kazachstania africana CBS 2517]